MSRQTSNFEKNLCRNPNFTPDTKTALTNYSQKILPKNRNNTTYSQILLPTNRNETTYSQKILPTNRNKKRVAPAPRPMKRIPKVRGGSHGSRPGEKGGRPSRRAQKLTRASRLCVATRGSRKVKLRMGNKSIMFPIYLLSQSSALFQFNPLHFDTLITVHNC